MDIYDHVGEQNARQILEALVGLTIVDRIEALELRNMHIDAVAGTKLAKIARPIEH
jgi:hypothetical protein